MNSKEFENLVDKCFLDTYPEFVKPIVMYYKLAKIFGDTVTTSQLEYAVDDYLVFEDFNVSN